MPYTYVAKHVDLLYEKQFQSTTEINNHCNFIRAFIHACGWEETELLRIMYNGKSYTNFELGKMN